MKIEYETSLSNTNMHIFLEQPYEEDYQMMMIRQNKIEGILEVEGCEIEGKSRYTYGISGYTSLLKTYEIKSMKKEELKDLIHALLDTTERIQKYMLEPKNLILNPECIFRKNGKWHFCYLPGNTEEMSKAFHQLSEYFVKAVDYGDTDAILLAYELHKASFQEHYSLKQIIDEYEMKGKKRDLELEELRRKQRVHENIFSLTDEEEDNLSQIKEKKPFVYDLTPAPATIHEEQGAWQYRVNKGKAKRKKRWGIWQDLIMESDD